MVKRPDKKLILQDGEQFYGCSFGTDKDDVLELVFNTSMVGYQEILSDPSYTDQAVVVTYPLIGNYGMAEDDYETDIPTVGAFIVREYNDEPSNFRSAGTLGSVMKRFGIPGISGVDTRKLTRSIRDKGSRRVLLTGADTPLEKGLKIIEESLLKGIRSLEIGAYHLHLPKFDNFTKDALLDYVKDGKDDRIFAIAALFRLGASVDEIADITVIDRLFLRKIRNIVEEETKIKARPFDLQALADAKKSGFSDKEIGVLWGVAEKEIYGLRIKNNIRPIFKMIDSCAAEFDSYIPYFYSTYEEENESVVSDKKKIVVLGSGPIRIGQGVEFDYSTVHAVQTIKAAGYEAIIINNNPETVSTDYTCSDKLYFEPLCIEGVMNVIELEKPEGVIVTLGGQTAINLADPLKDRGVNIIGTDCDAIDRAENRDLFENLLISLDIPQPRGKAVTDIEEGVKTAAEIGYPVLVRPSFVLGGRAMQIVAKERDMRNYLKTAVEIDVDKPVLIDKYIKGKEVEVDAVCDGRDVFVPGIMELVERTGVHSGDSVSVYPPYILSDKVKALILKYTTKLGLGIGIVGLFNIQFIVDKDDNVYIIEVNPRSSRTVPVLSKATGFSLADIGTRVMLGITLKEQGIFEIYPKEKDRFYIKVPAFSFSKLYGMDSYLSPEMKSTGEAIGYDSKLHRAAYKALTASGMKLKNYGTVLVSVADEDKEETIPLVRRFYNMGFNIEAMSLTAHVLCEHGIRTRTLGKPSEGSDEIVRSIRAGYVSYVINTRVILSGVHYGDGYAIRRAARRTELRYSPRSTPSACSLTCLKNRISAYRP